ncbi:hypothetical protein F4678DRAFT_467733 [Xylaria arbuscula]|nr:hypothetical protein F4678DRAFT_467733 [Xylaria arbuscula]
MPLPVFLVAYRGNLRDHHALFISTNGEDGQLFHVIGSISKGMQYETKRSYDPETSKSFIGSRQIGWVSSSALKKVDEICRSNPPPEKQLIGNTPINQNKPLRRCQEWTNETIQMLEVQGVLTPMSGGASSSSSGTGGRSRYSPSQGQGSSSSYGHSSSHHSDKQYASTSTDGYDGYPNSYNITHGYGRNTSTDTDPNSYYTHHHGHHSYNKTKGDEHNTSDGVDGYWNSGSSDIDPNSYNTHRHGYHSYNNSQDQHTSADTDPKSYDTHGHGYKQSPNDGDTSADGYWKWNAAYGDWYHRKSNGRYIWYKQSGSSSRGRRS